MAEMDNLKKTVDEYYDEMKYDAVVECLEPHKDGNDVDLLWRLARANYERHRTLPSDAAKLQELQKNLQIAERAVQLDECNANAHKWVAIYLNAITKLQGSKAQIDEAKTIKEHMLLACEYGPDDPTNWHLIGMWEFTVADISWVMRKLAQVVYGEPPKATFQEALEHFLRAEELSGRYSLQSPVQDAEWPIRSRNLLMIGKSYHKLKDNENAVKYLRMTRDRPAKTAEDKEAQEESLSLLKQMGVRD